MQRSFGSRVALVGALLTACSGAGGGEPRSTRGSDGELASAPAEPAGVVETSAEAPRELDPASTCGRALGCCRAYTGAIPDVVESSACAGVLEAMDEPDPDARCSVMAHGWRLALERMRGEAPEPCR